MADERPPIEGKGGQEFEQAAKRVLQRATKAVSAAETAATDARQAGEAIRGRARQLAQKMGIQETGGGRYYVSERVRGSGPGGWTDAPALREGQQRPGYFRSREAAEAARLELATARATAEARAAEATAVERTERRKTDAVRKGSTARRTAARQETNVVAGNAEEFERIAQQHAQRAADALDPGAKRRYEAARKPLAPAQREAAARELAAAADVERRRTELVPRSAGGGGRDVVRHIADQEAAGEARIAKLNEKAETDKLIRAEAAERRAREAATRAKEQEAIRAREAANRPGTALIEHPTEFGRRQPGPFAFYPEEIGGGGGRPTRAYGPEISPLQLAARRAGPPPGPVHGPHITDDQLAELSRQRREGEQGLKNQAAAANFASSGLERYTAQTNEARQALQYMNSAMGSSSTAWRAHGALTTEFIEAAARGETSYREWGYQIGATAAKFAGWTAVSIPVFAALDGIRQVGQGAIASSTGVNQLQRVMSNINGDDAKQTFRDLAGEFNVPIETATDAVFRMGQVFHDLPNATQAARAALYAFQVGGVDVEKGTRSLISIVNGFGLSGDQMAAKFDQINQAQNQFGVRIEDTQLGIAKAAGAFRNAGGEFDYLLALISTGTKVTSRTGENIGTAIQRSVGFIQRPKNQEQLRAFGIDPTAGIEEVYDQAFQVAQGLQGENLQRLATALSSPQYASYFVPILQNKDLFEQIQSGTSPAASKNSAQKELETFLGAFEQRLKRIGTDLQQLGSNLEQAGFGLLLIGAVEALNQILTLSNNILEVFNELPKPLRTAVALMIQARTILALGRRTNVGEGLAGTRLSGLAPYLVETQERRATRTIGSGERSARKAAQEEQQRRVADARREASATVAVAEQRDQIKAESSRLLAAGKIDQVEAEQRVAAANDKLARYTARSVESIDRAESAIRQSYETQAQIDRRATAQSQLRGLRDPQGRRYSRGAANVEFARQEGMFLPGTLSTDRPQPVLPERAQDIFGPGYAGPLPAGQRTPTPASRQLSRAYSTAAARVRNDARGFQTLRTVGGTWFAATQVAEYESRQLVGGTARAAQAARGLPGALRGAAAAIGAFALGPLDLIFAALLIVPTVFDTVKSALKDNADTLEKMSARPTSMAGVKEEAKRLEREAKGGEDFGDIVNDIFGRGMLDVIQNGTSSEIERAQAKQTQASNRALAQANARAASRGKARRLLPLDQIAGDIDQDFGAFARDAIDLAELRRRRDLRLKEIEAANASQGAKANLSQRLRTRFSGVGDSGDFYSNLADLMRAGGDIAQDFSKQAEGLEALIDAGIATDRDLQRYQAIQLAVLAKAKGNSPQAQAARAGAIKALVDAPKQVAETRLQRDLLFARTQEERDRAYERAFQTLDQAQPAAARLSRARLRGNRQERARLRAQLTDVLGREQLEERQKLGATPPGVENDQLGAEHPFERSDDEKRLRRQLRKLGVEGRDLRRAMRATRKQRREAIEELRRQQFQDQQANYEAETAVEAGLRPAGEGRIRYQIERQGRTVRRVIEQYGRDSTEAMQAIAEQQSLRNELVQEQARMIQAQADYAAAGETTEGGRSAARAGGLQTLLAFQRAHPRQFSPADRLQTMTQIREAAQQRQEQERQEYSDLLRARYDFLQSLTDDPVKIARLQAQYAQRIVARGGFSTAAERYQALAERNRTKRDYAEKVTDRRLEQLDLDEEIGRITLQQQIAGYERALRSTKAGTEYKRQLRNRILRLKHELEEGGDFELNVGDIRLPTLYEIRRAVGGRQRNVSVTNRNTVNVNVDGSTNMDAFASAMDSVIHGSGKSVARAAGAR